MLYVPHVALTSCTQNVRIAAFTQENTNWTHFSLTRNNNNTNIYTAIFCYPFNINFTQVFYYILQRTPIPHLHDMVRHFCRSSFPSFSLSTYLYVSSHICQSSFREQTRGITREKSWIWWNNSLSYDFHSVTRKTTFYRERSEMCNFAWENLHVGSQCRCYNQVISILDISPLSLNREYYRIVSVRARARELYSNDVHVEWKA